jgi:hypothetical protein
MQSAERVLLAGVFWRRVRRQGRAGCCAWPGQQAGPAHACATGCSPLARDAGHQQQQQQQQRSDKQREDLMRADLSPTCQQHAMAVCWLSQGNRGSAPATAAPHRLSPRHRSALLCPTWCAPARSFPPTTILFSRQRCSSLSPLLHSQRPRPPWPPSSSSTARFIGASSSPSDCAVAIPRPSRSCLPPLRRHRKPSVACLHTWLTANDPPRSFSSFYGLAYVGRRLAREA